MRKISMGCSVLLLFVSCSNIVHKTNEVATSTAKEVGQQVGEKSTQFVGGVKDGIDRAYGCTVELSPGLKAQGLEMGKFVISKDSGSDANNKLSVYLIANKQTDIVITAQVYDAAGKEYGRVTTILKWHAAEAHYVDFVFDKRTDIEGRSKIVLH